MFFYLEQNLLKKILIILITITQCLLEMQLYLMKAVKGSETSKTERVVLRFMFRLKD